MALKFGDLATFDVTDIDGKGRGCAKVGEREACVHFAMPGETVEGKMVGRKQGVLQFDLLEVKKASAHRVAPRCHFAGRCGGCVWQHVDYAEQLELKRRLVNRSLASAGLGEPIAAVVPSPIQYGFRNRMDYCVSWRGEVGLKAPGRWNHYLDLTECHLLSPDAAAATNAFREWMKRNAVQPWDAVKYSGYARYLVIREGKNTGERMIIVVTAEGELPAREDLIATLSPYATTLLHGITASKTDLSYAERFETLKGEPVLHEMIDGKTYVIPPNSFFQTNTVMAGELLATVGRFLGPERVGTLLDLYCGVGFFGIALANRAEQVLGVELDAEAIAVATGNAERNGVTNARFIAAPAEALSWEAEQPDVVIVDPPRSGLHPKVAQLLVAKRPPVLIYISCKHSSFARDWAILKEAYEPVEFAALDLFPHGPHAELAVKMRLK
jgi:23S rRNA (uracil-5-)-methyltransferase RumA